MLDIMFDLPERQPGHHYTITEGVVRGKESLTCAASRSPDRRPRAKVIGGGEGPGMRQEESGGGRSESEPLIRPSGLRPGETRPIFRIP